MILPYKSDVETKGLPFLSMGLLALNIAIHAFVEILDPAEHQLFYFEWGFVPFDHRPAQWVTSMFLHGGLLHLAGNMLFLWIYGPAVEEGLGKFVFIPAYLLSGVVAALIHSTTTPQIHMDIPCIGASGAISGLMGTFFVLYPQARIRHVIFIFLKPLFISLPAWTVLGMWFLEQGFMSFYISDYMNVAVFAHLGGFLAGGMMGFVFKPRHDFSKAPDIVLKAPLGAAASKLEEQNFQKRYMELKHGVEESPHDFQLRYSFALAAIRAADPQTSLEETKYILQRLPEHDMKQRFNIRLLQTALGQRDDTPRGMLELAEGFYSRNHYDQAYPLYARILAGWPDYPRRTLVLVRLGELLIKCFNRPEEARPFLEEVTRGDPRGGLVQEAQMLLKQIRPA